MKKLLTLLFLGIVFSCSMLQAQSYTVFSLRGEVKTIKGKSSSDVKLRAELTPETVISVPTAGRIILLDCAGSRPSLLRCLCHLAGGPAEVRDSEGHGQGQGRAGRQAGGAGPRDRGRAPRAEEAPAQEELAFTQQGTCPAALFLSRRCYMEEEIEAEAQADAAEATSDMAATIKEKYEAGQ